MSTSPAESRTCNQCNEPVKGEIVRALDKTWHPMHFCCTGCKQPIRESTFSSEKDMPYCTLCYQEYFLNKCHSCGEPITKRHVKAMGVYWHEDHFICHQCNSKLIGTEFMETEGVPYCQKCYFEKHAPRCKACSTPISDKAVVALDGKWHEKCFKCSRCEKPISKDQSFLVDAGKPHCVEC